MDGTDLVMVAILAAIAIIAVAGFVTMASADRAKAEACTHARDVAACLQDIK